MDQIAQDTFLMYFRQSGTVQALLSEESELPVHFPVDCPSPCLVAMDPLDGSSNLAVNASVGSIFAVFRPARTPLSGSRPRDCSRRAIFLYSVSTSLVLAIDERVHR